MEQPLGTCWRLSFQLGVTKRVQARFRQSKTESRSCISIFGLYLGRAGWSVKRFIKQTKQTKQTMYQESQWKVGSNGALFLFEHVETHLPWTNHSTICLLSKAPSSLPCRDHFVPNIWCRCHSHNLIFTLHQSLLIIHVVRILPGFISRFI